MMDTKGAARAVREPGATSEPGIGLAERFSRIGIQTRIMLYVTVGLVTMFGGFAYLGFRAVGDATQLVYEERLSTAYTTASIIERDFVHIARDADEVFADVETRATERLQPATARLAAHLATTDPFPFFRVTGVWSLTDGGTTSAAAGEPAIGSREQIGKILSAATEMGEARHFAIPAVGATSTGVPFGTIVIRLAQAGGSPPALVAVHAVSVNSSADYTPGTYWRTAVGAAGAAQSVPSEMGYHLEVVDPDGLAVLGIGADERPGEVSPHLAVAKGIMARREAAVIVHQPVPGEGSSAHAMAVVPLGSSRFYLILEQPTDVALSLPIDLGRSVGLAAVVGFFAALVVAWITTRHVTGPTEQLTVAAQRMAQGDLESPIKIRAQDEVGRLAENLDAMRRQLRDAYQQVTHANDRLELLDLQDVDDEGQDVGAAGERHSRDHVEADPDPPRVVLGEVGHGAQPVGEPDGDHHEAGQDDHPGDDVERRQHLSLRFQFAQDEPDRFPGHLPEGRRAFGARGRCVSPVRHGRPPSFRRPCCP